MSAGQDYDALRTHPAAFFELLANERGVRLRLNLPDTLEGYVVQRPAARCSFEDVRQHLLTCAQGAHGRCPPHVAVLRLADGTPMLLSRPALDALCARLAAQAAAGERGDEGHCVLQAYVAPFLDLRFVTSFTNDGAAASCHTFQRRFSRRYLPYRAPAGSAAAGQPEPADAAQPAAPAPEGAPAAGGDDAAPAQEHAGEEEAPSSADLLEGVVPLDDGTLADSEAGLARTLGPVDPGLKMLARKAAHCLVQYVQRAHLLTLRGLVCEFARDAQGHLWFLGPLRTGWASLIPGRGGEPWANVNLTQAPLDEASWPGSAGDEAAAPGGEPAAAAAAQPSAQEQGAAAAEPGSASAPAPAGCALPVQPKKQPEEEQPGSPCIPAHPSRGAAAASLPQQLQVQVPAAAPRRSPAKERSPGPSPSAASRQQALCGSPSGAGGGGGLWGRGGGGGSSTRGSAVLTSQLTRELEGVRDELLVQADLAERLAERVHALEHEKQVMTAAFETVLGGAQGDLVDVKGRLEELRRERDSLARQLAEAGQRLAGAEAEREQLRGLLDTERGAAFLSLGQFQRQQARAGCEDAGLRAAAADAELASLQERLREEQAACDALKKQMVAYQNAGGCTSCGCPPPGALAAEAGRSPVRPPERPELKYAETLQAVEDLLQREADPMGERYSLSKVLHTCQGDLHAIFLHYSMLDPGFARHWPPQLTLQGWLALMKDVGSTNLVPGTRTRSDNTMHVQEATDVFRRYSQRPAPLRSSPPPQRGLSILRDPAAAAAMAAAAAQTLGGPGDQPPRPPSSHSTAPSTVSARPFSAALQAQLAGASLSYQAFCAALVHVASKKARGSPELAEACPFLSEQTRAFVESILPRAQQVAPVAVAAKKGGAGAGGAGGGAGPKSPAGGAGAKDAAAKEAAARLPKLKGKGKGRAGGGLGSARGGGEMSAITEASREGSAALPHAAG